MAGKILVPHKSAPPEEVEWDGDFNLTEEQQRNKDLISSVSSTSRVSRRDIPKFTHSSALIGDVWSTSAASNIDPLAPMSEEAHIASLESQDEEEEFDQSKNPPMFLVGQAYKQRCGSLVLILGNHQANTRVETVYGMVSTGHVIHWFNRVSFGTIDGSLSDSGTMLGSLQELIPI